MHQAGEPKKAFGSMGRAEALGGGHEAGEGQGGPGQRQRSPPASGDGSWLASSKENDQSGLVGGEGGRRAQEAAGKREPTNGRLEARDPDSGPAA